MTDFTADQSQAIVSNIIKATRDNLIEWEENDFIGNNLLEANYKGFNLIIGEAYLAPRRPILGDSPIYTMQSKCSLLINYKVLNAMQDSIDLLYILTKQQINEAKKVALEIKEKADKADIALIIKELAGDKNDN